MGRRRRSRCTQLFTQLTAVINDIGSKGRPWDAGAPAIGRRVAMVNERAGGPGEIQMHGSKLSEIGKNVRNELNRYKRAIKGRN